MSNPAATIPIGVITPSSGPTLDVQRSDWGIMLELVVGLNEAAEVRGRDDVIPGLAGRIPRNRVKDRRSIELFGIVQGSGATEALRLASFRDLVDAIQNCFDPTKTVTIPITAEDSTSRSIVARPLSLIWSPENVPGVRMLSIGLESIAPDWS